MGARVAGDEVAERVGERLEERVRDADRQRRAERIAQAPGVFDRRDPRDARDRDRDRAPGVDEFGEVRGGFGGGRGTHGGGIPRRSSVLRIDVARIALGIGDLLGIRGGFEPRRDLGGVERAQHAQQVGHALEPPGAAIGVEALRLALELRHDLGVEQLAHLDLAEQFAQQRRVDRQRRGTAFGQRRIALVHERADVPEQQVARERRGRGRRGLDQADAAIADAAGDAQQRGNVVDVLQHLAEGLEDDRERRVPARDLEQLRRPLTLLPERRPAVGVHPRHEQRAGGALAEARGEQRRAAHLVDHDLLELVGLEHEQLRAGRLGGRHPAPGR